MTGNLQFRRGIKSNLPISAPNGMPLWCIDTEELYIGTENGVVKVLPVYDMQDLTSKQSSGTIQLENNSVNFINVTKAIIFALPYVYDNPPPFSQIFIQLSLPTVKTINLGTDYFFNNEIPDLSKPGLYDIIYEFNPIIGEWFCGVLVQRITE